jgi:hypothetical protein
MCRGDGDDLFDDTNGVKPIGISCASKMAVCSRPTTFAGAFGIQACLSPDDGQTWDTERGDHPRRWA